MADNNQMREILEKLDEGVKSLYESDKYAEYLSVMSRFHKYSTRNTILIYAQKPDSRQVAGYQSWRNNFNRQVKKGERGIRILAPMPFAESKEFEKLDPVTKQPVLDENGQPVMETLMRMGARFKTVSVFDVSQTEGEPLPELAETLTGDVERYELFMDALRAVSPLPIVFEDLPPDTDGVCHSGDRIAIRNGMSEIQTVAAVIHEITHAKLHDRELAAENGERIDRRAEEVTAESVSFVVNNHFSIETGANSFGYIVEWSKTKELKELHASLDAIRKTAAELIDGIEEQYRTLAKERGIDLSAKTPAQEQELPTPQADEPVQEADANLTPTIAAEAPQAQHPLIAEYANAKTDWLIGSNVLLTPLFYDGNFNRGNRRIRVKVEEPIGKYPILSDGDGNDKTLFILTASGRIAELYHFIQREWSNELHKNVDVRPTEADLDAALIKASEKFEQDMSDPAKWVRYQDAAVVNRLDECETHNIPVREAREAEDARRSEAAEKARQEELLQKQEKFDSRIDEIADAIHKGKAISVGYSEHDFDGRNPVLDLFKLYGVEIPLRTQGWVNTGLAEINGESYRYYKSRHKGDSTTFHKYLKKLREAIDKTPIEQKRSENSIPQNGKGGENVQYSELQQKGFEYARRHGHLPLSERLGIIAKAFNCNTATISTVPCTGKYRGQSDIMLTLDNGASMGIGMYATATAKKPSTISDCVNITLARFNPEIVAETKERAAAALKIREAEDNRTALERGLKPYKFLNVELSEGSNPREGASLGWYYATLAVDGRVFGLVESHLASDIERGEVAAQVSRPNFYIAGGLKDTDADFVFNNVGFSSLNSQYKMVMSDGARQRAEAKLAESQPDAPANGVYAKYCNIVAERAAQYAVSSGTLHKDAGDAREACDQIVNRVVNDMLLEAGEHYPLFQNYMGDPDFKGRLEDYAFIKAYLEPMSAIEAESRKPPRVDKAAHGNYIKFAEMFPQIASGEYSYMKLESQGYEPLSIEHIGDNMVSVMHTYKMNGDLMYDPMITFEIDSAAQTLTAAEFEQSMPPLYQRVTEDNGDGQSIDGNGNERTVKDLRGKIDSFTAQWLDNIKSQEYSPITAMLAGREENARIEFDKGGNPIMPEDETPATSASEPAMPDPDATFAEMCYYGYTYENMLPLHEQAALELFDADKTVYLLYPDNTEAMALDREEIQRHDGLFGIEKPDWERMQAAAPRVTENSRESELLHNSPGMFGIYQIRDGIDDARDFRFAPMRELEAHGIAPDRANYELVYAAPLTIHDVQTNLHKIFADYQGENPERPADFAGRSASVSDVIVLQWRGEVSAHYVDSAGFKELPHFTGEEREQPTAQETKQEKQTFFQVEKRGSAPGEPPVSKGKPDLLAKIAANKQRVARENQPAAQKNNERRQGHDPSIHG